MTPERVLAEWKQVCDGANMNWYLFAETLLCANALQTFPEEMTCAVVAVCRENLEKARKLLADLASGLSLETVNDGILADGKTILRVCVYPVPEGNKNWISCGGVQYPAFPEYRGYLEETYGDYEQGFFDGMGVGLSREEKNILKSHQKKCVQALKFVQEVSREYSLRYYLLAGSVLGAVRHGGFIPWDDDIDIGIREEDRERFERIVKEQLPVRLGQGFTLEQPAPGHRYPRMFSKICYEGRCCIDLWPLVPTAGSGLDGKLTWLFGKILMKLHYCKIGYPVERFQSIAKILCWLLNDRQIMALARWNQCRSLEKAEGYVNLYSIYSREKETIARRWLDTETTAEFEGLMVPVVGCTEQYLTHLYGDYMRLPPVWKRASRHVERFLPPLYF